MPARTRRRDALLRRARRAVAGACRTIAIDLPGSGLSPLDGTAVSFSFDAVADLVVGLAHSEHVGVQGRQGGPAVYLLGHSMGTILALEVIRRAPDLAAGLIIVGGLPEPLPGARTRVEIMRDCGHLPFLEQPAAFAAIVSSFLFE